jgi:hypothetical protein
LTCTNGACGGPNGVIRKSRSPEKKRHRHPGIRQQLP